MTAKAKFNLTTSVGAALVSGGAYWMYPPAGVLVAGCFMFVRGCLFLLGGVSKTIDKALAEISPPDGEECARAIRLGRERAAAEGETK